MKSRSRGTVIVVGLILTGAVGVLFGDSVEALQAFRKGDYATAFREWQAAARQGHPEAEYNLGLMYLKGLGVPKDPEEAFRWLYDAAEKGFADAQFQVGLMREKGVGVHQDYAQAEVWYALAADRGESEAEMGLGTLYEQGHGVKKDLARAVSWYRKAADQGMPEAQYHLGMLSERGRGMAQDFSVASIAGSLPVAAAAAFNWASSCALCRKRVTSPRNLSNSFILPEGWPLTTCTAASLFLRSSRS